MGQIGGICDLLIPGYPEGSDITILNTAYIGRRKNSDGKIQKDYISLLFKDNVTGQKHIHNIFEPEYTYYKLKDMYQLDHHLFFIDKDKVEPVTCKYSELLRDIAKQTGNEEFFYDNIRSGNSGENRKLHTLNNIFSSDINVEDYYRMLFAREYKNEPIQLNKAYLDIETDGIHQVGDFPEMGEVPINAVAFMDERSGTIYQFLLENDANPLIAQYKEQLQEPGMMDKIQKFITKSVGGYKKAKKYGVDNLKLQFLFFREEIELIQALFDVINQTSPDILLIWNMAFDLNYIIARIEALGYDPKSIICDPRIETQYLKYYVDERNKNEFAERGDFVNCSQFLVWLDQMIHFASRRKGRGQFASFKLDDIGHDIARVNKLDYSYITTKIEMLPYLNYLVFSWYNLMDVIVQKCIESKTADVDYIFTKCLVNNTRYEKGHRQSVYLANRFTKDFYNYGYIIGNNVNKWNEKPATKYPGAMVGDPLHNSDYAVLYINGQPTLLAANVIDYDYKSLYPSITLENNMAPNTQIGRIELPDPISYMEHPDMYASNEDPAKYSRSGEFLENMMSGNHLEFCKRWLHLGDFHEVEDDMFEYFMQNIPTGAPPSLHPRDTIYFSSEPRNAIEFMSGDYTGARNALFFYADKPGSYEELVSTIRKDAYIQ